MKKLDKYALSNKITSMMQPTEKNINDLQNKLWYIIKHEEGSGANNSNQIIPNTNDDYTICLNDILKLGRVKYSANEINLVKQQGDVLMSTTTTTQNYNISSINEGTAPVFDFIFKTSTPEAKELEEATCKICISGGSDEANPLVTLCRCIGGMRYSHYDCIKRWMQTKLSKKENEKKTVSSYNIKSFNCEICKSPYPFRFVINNPNYQHNTYDLIEIVRPTDKSYIILESLNQLKDNNNLKSIHVILLDDQKITLGRGHESDVRINDISVSRQHAVLLYDSSSGKITIRDLKSKFGTLALIKNDLKINDKKIQLQIGRTFFECSLISTDEYNKLKKQKFDRKVQQQTQQQHPGFQVNYGLLNGSGIQGNFALNNQQLSLNAIQNDFSLTNFALNQNNEFMNNNGGGFDDNMDGNNEEKEDTNRNLNNKRK